MVRTMKLQTIRTLVMVTALSVAVPQIVSATIVWGSEGECSVDPNDSEAMEAAANCDDDREGEVSQCVIDELGLAPCTRN